MKHYSANGRRYHGRLLKKFLDTWDRNGSTGGPTHDRYTMMMMMMMMIIIIIIITTTHWVCKDVECTRWLRIASKGGQQKSGIHKTHQPSHYCVFVMTFSWWIRILYWDTGHIQWRQTCFQLESALSCLTGTGEWRNIKHATSYCTTL